jgi:hypothetical protein
MLKLAGCTPTVTVAVWRLLGLGAVAAALLAMDIAAPAQTAPAGPDKLPELNKKVKEYVDGKVGMPRIGKNKECFDLADLALKAAGAKTAFQYGKVVKEADYVWGELKDLKLALPGDIIQFRDFEVRLVKSYKLAKGQSINGMMYSGWKQSESLKREHHTAVVTGRDGDGKLIIVEQKIVDPATGKLSDFVERNVLYVADQEFATPAETITVKDNQGNQVKLETEGGTVAVTVKGTLWVYRPQPAGK